MIFALIWSFAQIGLFSIGGGYAALPLIRHQIVELNGWLNMTEFADVITISQMTPGPIAINAATFVGMRIAGLGGALAATFGCVLPSCVIVLTLAKIYVKYGNLDYIQGALSGLRPGVVALIASAGLSIMTLAFFGDTIALANVDWVAVGLFVAAFAALRVWKKLDPVLAMVGCGAVGLAVYLLLGV